MWYFCAVFLFLFSLIQSVDLQKKFWGHRRGGGGRPPPVNPPLVSFCELEEDHSQRHQNDCAFVIGSKSQMISAGDGSLTAEG